MSAAAPLVEIDRLTIDFWQQDAWLSVVSDLSLRIAPGEVLGLAGESGCGKTTVAYSLLGYRRPGSRVRAGAVRFAGRDLLRLAPRELQALRGAQIGLVPQNPATALSPSLRVGRQVAEILEAHGACAGRAAAWRRAVDLLAEVALPQPEELARRYPHQLSGGQQQRVALAMALACRPRLVVLDEPTTGLDVTTQARILQLLAGLRRDYSVAMLYVSHDLGVLAQICDRIAVMYAGELVEIGPTAALFRSPRHPYARGLVAAMPRLSAPPDERGLLRGLLRRDELPQGCRFAPRCAYALPECAAQQQPLLQVDAERAVACWRWQLIGDARAVSRHEVAT